MNVDLDQQKSEWCRFLATSTGKRFIEYLEIKQKAALTHSQVLDRDESFAYAQRAVALREVKEFIDNRKDGKEKVLQRLASAVKRN